jgi:hypothetical protein
LDKLLTSIKQRRLIYELSATNCVFTITPAHANPSPLEPPKHFFSAAFAFLEPFMRTQSSSQIRPQAAEPPRVLLMARDAYGFTTRINDFKRGGADPSQTKFFIGGNDVTQSSRVKSLSNDSVEVSFKLKEPLKAQANLEIRLETNKRGGGIIESRVGVDIISSIAIPPVITIVYDDIYFDPSVTTPVVSASGSGILAFYRKSDIQDSEFINLPVFAAALDEKQRKIQNLNSNFELEFFNNILEENQVISTKGTFQNGILRAEIRIPKNKFYTMEVPKLVLISKTVRSQLTNQGNIVTRFMCLPGDVTIKIGTFPFFLNGETDSFGDQLVEHYLHGSKRSFIQFNDPLWSAYMQTNEILRSTLDNVVRDEIRNRINFGFGGRVVGRVVSGVALCDDGKVIGGALARGRCATGTGQGLLNGSNNSVGGLEYDGVIQVKKNDDDSWDVTTTICYTFNDIADFEIKKYGLDLVSNAVTFFNRFTGEGGEYRVAITWCTTATAKAGSNGVIYDYQGYPFRNQKFEASLNSLC